MIKVMSITTKNSQTQPVKQVCINSYAMLAFLNKVSCEHKRKLPGGGDRETEEVTFELVKTNRAMYHSPSRNLYFRIISKHEL